MFAMQRRDNGFVTLGAVALVLVAWLVGAGVMLKTYRDGAASRLPSDSTCHVVCQGTFKGKG